MVEKKNYQLSHALAYETTINDAEVIAVVLSGQAISSEELKKAKEREKDGNDSDFKRPTSSSSSRRRGTSSSGAPVRATRPWAGGAATRPEN